MFHLRTVAMLRARSSRKTEPLTSKTAAKYSGRKSRRSLLIMLTKTKVAAVGTPERVDMGRCRCIAW